MTSNNEKQVVDLMVYANRNEVPPAGVMYKFKIKNEVFTVDVESMTGRQICLLAGLVPEQVKLSMKVKNGFEDIELDETVSFLKPGIEKFTYIQRDPIEG